LNLSEKDDCIPEYPELIDLKITDMCLHGCPFCYMGSTGSGIHANIKTLKSIIYSINDDSNNDRCVEFSIGGGNILLYPDLDELFYYIKNNGHIVNTTINAKDCKELINNDSLFTTFNRYVTAIGISITDESEIPDVVALYKKFYKGNGYKQMTAHLIPEYLGIEKSRNIVNQLYKNCLVRM
jgi:MoaA/NifB/PqqE/SkfB family radical SAM enzyme